MLQLDFGFEIVEKPIGQTFMKISDPYLPIDSTYVGNNTGGMLINKDGTCGGWMVPGYYFVHIVYAIKSDQL